MLVSLSRTTHWWRRRAPADLPKFSRRVWWVGHGQLFAAPVSALAGVALIAFDKVQAITTGMTFLALGVLLLAMAAPFLVSGLLLRAYATSRTSVNGSAAERVATLTLAVLGIAVLSIGFTVAVGLVLVVVVLPVVNLIPFIR